MMRSRQPLLLALLPVLFCQSSATAQQSPGQGPLIQAPADSEIPNDDLGRSIRRGLALLSATHDSLPRNAPASLACVSCHPDGGRRANAMPWVGVYGRYPQYRSRSGSVGLLEDRINDCFERSMNGRALKAGQRDMRDIVTYMAYLSKGTPIGGTVPGQGLPKLSVTTGDTTSGGKIFVASCAKCHGDRGQGTPLAPPLWGPASFNIGAGMGRVRTAAAFIRYNMPFDQPGTLSDQQAFDVARYITSRPRPDLAGKENDWPNGDPPPDVAYPTKAARMKPDSSSRKP